MHPRPLGASPRAVPFPLPGRALAALTLLLGPAATQQSNATPPASQVPTSFYDVTRQVKLGGWVSTPADPLDDRDDSEALQELIDHVAQDSQGGTLWFPNGLYYLESPLVIPPNHSAASRNGNAPLFGLTLLGASLGATLYCTNPTGALVVAGAEGPDLPEPLTFVRRLCVRNLRMVDAAVNQPDWKKSRRGTGLRLCSAEHCVFENIEVHGFDVGVQVELGSPNNCFTNLSVQQPKTYGIWITSEGIRRPFGARAWHTDNFWTNIRVSGHNSFEADPTGRPEAGIKISGPYVGDQHFNQAIVGFCRIGVHLLGTPAGAVEPYTNDVKLSSLIADMNEVEDLRIDHVANVRVSDAFIGVRGVTILDASEVMISNSWFNGDRSKWSPPETLTALEVHNASGIGIANCTFRGFDRIGNFVNVITSTVSDIKAHCSTPCQGDWIAFRLADAPASAPFVRGSADNSFHGNLFVIEPGGTARSHYGIVEQITGAEPASNQYLHNRFRGRWTAGNRFVAAGSGSRWVD